MRAMQPIAKPMIKRNTVIPPSTNHVTEQGSVSIIILLKVIGRAYVDGRQQRIEGHLGRATLEESCVMIRRVVV